MFLIGGRAAEGQARRRRVAPLRAILLWALVVAPFLTWGLPDRRADDLLFGGQPPWPATRLAAQEDLRRLRESVTGADADLNPLTQRDRIVELTADDAARAEILRRYRLFSRQPDEMIIFRALQRMAPRQGDFDPCLYQYGGVYIYSVGALLAAGGALGLLHLTRDIGFYLEQPEQFARFYVAARLVSLFFGGLALLAVFRLAARAGGRRAGWVAMLCAGWSPVFLTAVVEAKPHLPSACWLLWAISAALDYRGRGRWSDALRLGVLGGLAFGYVLTGAVAILLWPALLWSSRATVGVRRWRHLALAGIVLLAVYMLANPYVLYNFLTGHGALGSNLTNSLAMYTGQAARAPEGLRRTLQLLGEAGGWGLPVAGSVGLVYLFRRHRGATAVATASGAGMLALAALLGAGKPAEFARFLVLPVLLLSCSAGAVTQALLRWRPWLGALAAVAVLVLMPTPAYIRALATDLRGEHESRYQAGRYLARHMTLADDVAILQEPAPYAVPPLDFARRRVYWLPPQPPGVVLSAELPDWLVFTADDARVWQGAWWERYYELNARFAADGMLSRITWANKPVFVYRRSGAAESASGLE